MIYLDNAATSRFKPQSVIDCYVHQAQNSSNSGRSGHTDCINLASKIYETREVIKEYVGASDDYEIIFTSGCTEALNLATLGYLKGKSGNVITTMWEHNSTLRPLHELTKREDITINYLTPNDQGLITPDMIESAIDSDTLLIAINHISNVTGVEQDLSAIGKVAESHGIPLLVDSAQSLGHADINMCDSHISMLAGCGHKGLQAMQGVGFLILRKDMQLSPVKFGGTGTSSDSLDQPSIIPEGFESGTLNNSGIVSLTPAIQWLALHGKKKEQSIKYLSGELLYGLKQIKNVTVYSHYPSSVISINISDFSSTESADMLNNMGVEVRSGLHCAPLAHKYLGTFERGTARLSIGYNNSIADIRYTLQYVENIAKM